MMLARRPQMDKDHWQLVFSWGKSPLLYDEFVRQLAVGFLKFKKMPEEGHLISKSEYRGFYRVYSVKVLISRRKD